MTNLAGRAALVTGAGGGIGRATALVLGELGMDVAVHYFRNAEGANGAVAKLKEIGRAAEAFEADLSQGDQARQMVRSVEERFGKIDVLVNNAGDLIEPRPLPETAFESVVRTLPLGRAGTPEAVARVIAFLASDDSAYLAGETIDISGGLYMR